MAPLTNDRRRHYSHWLIWALLVGTSHTLSHHEGRCDGCEIKVAPPVDDNCYVAEFVQTMVYKYVTVENACEGEDVRTVTITSPGSQSTTITTEITLGPGSSTDLVSTLTLTSPGGLPTTETTLVTVNTISDSTSPYDTATETDKSTGPVYSSGITSSSPGTTMHSISISVPTETTGSASTTSSESVPDTTTSPATSSSPSQTSLSVLSTSAPSSTTTSQPSATTTAPTTTSAPPIPTFSCDPNGYLIQSKALYQVDLKSGKETLIRDPVGDGDKNINAIAYHPKENVIYGVLQTSTGDSNLIKILADGSSEILGEVPHEMNKKRYNLNVGEINDKLQFFFGTGGKQWWQMDLSDPSSDTYRQIVDMGLADAPQKINDWVQVPGAGEEYLWSLGEKDDVNPTESVLMKWNAETHDWTVVRYLGHLSGKDHWGALYADNDGNMYGSENNSGDIYKFAIKDLEAGGDPEFLTKGTPSSRNDGARCHAVGL